MPAQFVCKNEGCEDYNAPREMDACDSVSTRYTKLAIICPECGWEMDPKEEED